MADQNSRLVDVEKKMAIQELLLSRFDIALDKMSEVSVNVSRLLAVHEQRLENHEAITRNIPEVIEERRKEYYQRFEEIHGRITESDTELRKEMLEGQKEILGEIKDLRTNVTDLGEELKEKHDHLRIDLENTIETKVEKVSQRVSKLEKMVWIAAGGATILGFIISQSVGIFQAVSMFFH